MRIQRMEIQNFKSVEHLVITDIENALILVGRNNVGKSSVLHGISAVGGTYQITKEDFNEKGQNIEIGIELQITEADMRKLHRNKVVSAYRREDIWQKDFCAKLPSYEDGVLKFTFIANHKGTVRYFDGVHKNNKYIKEVFPKIYYLDCHRNVEGIQEELLSFMEDDLLNQMREDCCLFERGKTCSHCFSCMGLINKKKPEELNAFETEKLLEYKLYQLNLNEFSKKVNQNFKKNGEFSGWIQYELSCNTGRIFQVNVSMTQKNMRVKKPLTYLGKGMRSIYLLSLLETYMDGEDHVPGIILMEDPEIYLHPKLQKVSSEILYRISRKTQVIFTTHSPNLLFQFNSRQIRQMVLDAQGYSRIKEKTNLSTILNDLGFTADDLMNVSFVFIVEGKQDKSRLPLLLEKYYSEVSLPDGSLSRISIITTNSCTNIKTYANLKYMNQVYLGNQFLMIRDGDGKDREELARSLCKYYEERNEEDIDHLPRVTQKNVLILKYYSFENYFLNPTVMKRIGIIQSEEQFYETLYEKWREYLYKIRSGRKLQKVLGHDLTSAEDVRLHMEEIKTYVRGHNLYNIFYGPFRKQEQEILKTYIDEAPREEFRDILDTVDQILYFENRKKK